MGTVSQLDRLAPAFLLLRPGRTIAFSDGWGEPRSSGLLTDTTGPDDPIAPISLDWHPTAGSLISRRRGISTSRAVFISPAEGLLPESCRNAVVERVSPLAKPLATVLILPSWNDEGFRSRRRLAVSLAARGIESLLLEAAHYGSRRSVPGTGQPIRTIAAFAQLGYATLAEARSILAVVDSPHRGIAGFSMGGNIAAIASATVPFSLAITTFAASHSPGPVFLEGAISKVVDWEALGPQPFERVASLFNRASALRLPALDHHATAVILAAASDGFVPLAATRALHHHWPGSSLQVLPGGHAEFMLRHRATVADAIVESFKRTFPDMDGSPRDYQSVGL